MERARATIPPEKLRTREMDAICSPIPPRPLPPPYWLYVHSARCFPIYCMTPNSSECHETSRGDRTEMPEYFSLFRYRSRVRSKFESRRCFRGSLVDERRTNGVRKARFVLNSCTRIMRVRRYVSSISLPRNDNNAYLTLDNIAIIIPSIGIPARSQMEAISERSRVQT